SGDTVLIGAVRGGHVEIVKALLQKYADIDIRGQESKTALYWAVEKGNSTMVRDILQCNPDTENCTKDGETPLIKATKMRNIDTVELLLDKGAKVSAVDKKGDTPLHIAIRGRSRRLAELLLRNPKDGRLLYRPNKAGETPYNIDCSHQKSILTQIFGARHLSPSECDGDMLGYDLYSSALADILSEPTMQPPICMKTFAGQQVEPLFQFSWLVVFLSLLLCASVALVMGFTVDPKLAMAVSLSLLALLYLFFVVVYFGGRREGENWTWAWVLSTRLARHLGYLELLLKLMFVTPPDLPEQSTRALPVRFLFTDYNRLSSVGGETSMAEMIATLSDACEAEFGFLAARLFRVFKTEDTQGKRKWKRTCCVPSFVLFLFILACLITGLALLAVFRLQRDNPTVNGMLVAVASVVGLALLLTCRTWWRVSDSVLHSQRKRLHSAANRLSTLKSEGFMKGPFISIFASDPHIIIKAINQNLSSVLRDSNINGHDYMRNIVHLPVFLNSRGLKLSQHSLGELTKFGSKTTLNRRDTYRRRQVQRSVTRQMSFDLNKLLVTEDWFSDISPQTMRRLLNIVSVTGRLLRANQITFNWDRLASWINLTEQWPYRTSWLLLLLEETDGVPDQTTLKTIYERISKHIPTTKDVEPLLEIDGDVRSFEVFLSSRTPVLTARDIKTFLPCTINLDPKLRETHSSYYSGLAGPQHPFYNRAAAASMVSGAPPVLLSSMTTEAVCERVRLVEGIDQSMLPQYTATIRKANVNGRVLTQCNIDELKKEMSMNFGDWQLFRATIVDMRVVESQVLQDDAASEQGGVAALPRAAMAPPHAGAPNPDGSSPSGAPQRTASMTSLNSQESANDIWRLTDRQQNEYRSAYQEYISQMTTLETGGERPVQPQPGHFLSPGPEAREGGETDARKPHAKRPGATVTAAAGKPAGDTPDGDALDPITEEDERAEHHHGSASSRSALNRKSSSSSERGGGASLYSGAAELKMKASGGGYQKLTSDEEESEESDHAPLLKGGGAGKEAGPPAAEGGSLALKGNDFLSDATLDKKDSSDSGVRSNESSPNHSLRDEEADLSLLERPNLMELDEEQLPAAAPRHKAPPPASLGDAAAQVTRMSICSEDRCSLLASSPDDSWSSYNLNRTPSNVTLNNNTNNRPRPPLPTPPSPPSREVISPPPAGSTTGVSTATTKPGPHNENVRVVHLKRGLNPGDPPEICSVSSDTVTFGEERESIL
ncbi:hypothetical protein CRUP_029077, partial [Coryphaenoides rupestris]